LSRMNRHISRASFSFRIASVGERRFDVGRQTAIAKPSGANAAGAGIART
jgi:hypothetical protein